MVCRKKAESMIVKKEPKRSQKKAPQKISERKQNILYKLAADPTITQVKLMEDFELTRKQVQSAIKELQKEGLLEREGSNRNGKWIAKI